jgi:hypothetical protein
MNKLREKIKQLAIDWVYKYAPYQIEGRTQEQMDELFTSEILTAFSEAKKEEKELLIKRFGKLQTYNTMLAWDRKFVLLDEVISEIKKSLSP